MIGIVTGLTAEARMARPLGVAQAGGGTSEGAAQAARALIAEGATALISFGVAGGLNPALPPGTLIVPLNVSTDAAIYATDPGLTARLGGPAHSLHATADIAVTQADKAALYKTSGADAVDMESGAVAEVAAAHGIKFAALRAICDPATRDLPPAALIALNAAGAISALSVAISVLRRPGQIPALLRLARDAAAARAALVKRVEIIGKQGW
jgi:adenosylhomocysteine nucleosidase